MAYDDGVGDKNFCNFIGVMKMDVVILLKNE